MFKDKEKYPVCFINKVRIDESLIPGAGLGGFATEPIAKYEPFERAHVIPFHGKTLEHLFELHDTPHIFTDYAFQWLPGEGAIVLGFGSIYNHDDDPNACWRPHYNDGKAVSMEYYALRDIAHGEEITVRYRRGTNRDPLAFDETGRHAPVIVDVDEKLHMRSPWQKAR